MIELIKRKAVCVSVKDNKNFYYVNFGSETHGKISFRIWISNKYVKKSEASNYLYIEFPILGNFYKTEKGTMIIKPESDNDYVIFPIETKCGYRGVSRFEILNLSEETFVLHYKNYRSPVGSLGIDDCGLIFTKKFPLLVKVQRTGRTYGNEKEGIFEIDYNKNLNEIIVNKAPDDLEVEKYL